MHHHHFPSLELNVSLTTWPILAVWTRFNRVPYHWKVLKLCYGGSISMFPHQGMLCLSDTLPGHISMSNTYVILPSLLRELPSLKKRQQYIGWIMESCNNIHLNQNSCCLKNSQQYIGWIMLSHNRYTSEQELMFLASGSWCRWRFSKGMPLSMHGSTLSPK